MMSLTSICLVVSLSMMQKENIIFYVRIKLRMKVSPAAAMTCFDSRYRISSDGFKVLS
jgi:hypothetical protein